MSNALPSAAPTLDRAAIKVAYQAAKSALRRAEEANGGIVPADHPAQVEYLLASEAWSRVPAE